METPGHKKTAVGTNAVRPTEYQIRDGHFVVPFQFYQEHREALAWKTRFELVAFGTEYPNKKIDDDRRLTVRLRDVIEPGDVLTLRILEDRLHVVKEHE